MLYQAAWAACASVALAAAVLTQAEPATKDLGPKSELSARDLKELGGFLGKALDPEKQDYKDKEKNVAELRRFLEKAGKTRNPKDPLQGGLALCEDLSRGLHIANEYKLAGTKPGQVAKVELLPKTNPVAYSIWLPKTYRADQEPFPVLMCFPGTKDGKVSSGEAFLQDHWTEAAVREKYVIVALNLPEDVKSWTEGQTAAGKHGGVAIAMLTLKELGAKHAIDFDRIYLAGREAGVAAALSLGAKFPQNFAGVVGRSGDCGDTPVNNFRCLPTFFAGAGAQATAFAEANKTAGYENCTLKPDGTDLDAIAWMDAHPRQANPAKVTLYPGRPIPLRAYWMKVQPTDVGAAEYKIEGEIDRATNTVTITSSGVRQVTLMLNDVLLNLDKPVKIVLNGTAQDALLPRSLDDMLSMMYSGLSEPGRIYVFRKEFDLPVAK